MHVSWDDKLGGSAVGRPLRAAQGGGRSGAEEGATKLVAPLKQAGRGRQSSGGRGDKRMQSLREQLHANLQPVLRPADFDAFDLDRAIERVAALVKTLD